jgi:tetratricopeptide (TPR) repeat protein
VKYLALLALAGIPAAAQPARLDSDRTLFNVLTAINLAGYDAEVDSPSNHPLRKEIRAELEARKLGIVPELRRFFAAHRKRDWTAELSQYISFALSVKDDGQYHWRFREEEIPPDAASLDGFNALMTRFHREADLDALWKRAEPTHQQALDRFHAPVTAALQQVDAYLRVPSLGTVGRQFRVYVDLMAAPHQIQARSYGDDFFIVLSPSPDLHLTEIRQAYIAFVVDPYATKFAVNVEKKRPLIDLAAGAPLLPEVYKSDFLLLTTKCLVRAIDARLSPASQREALVKQALGEGYILTPYFAEALVEFEKQESSMRIYYPEMIDAIDLRKEDRRLAEVEFLSQPVERKVIVRAAEEKVELTGARKTLDDAENLYDSLKLDASREKFLAVLEETPEKAVQARATYGLARIAALQSNPELSFKLFERVLELEPEPPTAAWTHIYLGRLSALAGEDEEAIRHFETASKIEGASRAAREAAQKALQEARKSR